MKKILFVLIVFAALSANAQIGGGLIFLSGSLGLNSSGSSNIHTNGGTTVANEGVSVLGFEFSPKAGYMLTKNIGAGLGISYDFMKTTTPDDFDNGTDLFDQVEKDGMFALAPFGRYYMGLSEKFYLYGELSFPIGFGNHKELMWNNDQTNVIDSDIKYNSQSIGTALGFGANYFLNNKIALEARFNALGLYIYSAKTTVEQANGDKNEIKNSGVDFGLDTGNLLDISNLTIGFTIFI